MLPAMHGSNGLLFRTSIRLSRRYLPERRTDPVQTLLHRFTQLRLQFTSCFLVFLRFVGDTSFERAEP
jgi:hypothetical protein